MGDILVKSITSFGRPCVLACDGECRKAWGMARRPRVLLSADPDDFAYLADGELGEAPADPGNYEDGYAKPTDLADPARQNKWCTRECERSEVVGSPGTLRLLDFSRRVPNGVGREP